MKKSYLLMLVYLLFSIPAFNKTHKDADVALNKMDHQVFIENKGQFPEEVLYLTRLSGLDAWITKTGVVYDFYKMEAQESKNRRQGKTFPSKYDTPDYIRKGHIVKMNMSNTNTAVPTEGRNKQQGYYNYFIGNNPEKFTDHVGLFKQALLQNIYNGIDMRYYFQGPYLRYDYIVKPGADATQIKFDLKGAKQVYLNTKGNLVFTTRFGEVTLAELHTYQGHKEIESKFVQQDGIWTIEVGKYNPSQPLIIDPIIYSTFIGGNTTDYGTAIAVDNNGNASILGYTFSADFPTTVGAYQTNLNVHQDLFVTKLNADGSSLIYSTYIGGTSSEYGNDLDIDADGNVYLTGNTTSSNFPTTSGVVGGSFNGEVDAFLCKLNSTGSALIYSTFIGGTQYENSYGITVDVNGRSYITGITASTDYPITSDAYDNSYNGDWDAFVTVLNSDFSNFVYSTFFGGTGEEIAFDIDLIRYFDALSGYIYNVYITGYTYSPDFPITSGAYQTNKNGFLDSFVSKININSGNLVYSSYFGGTGDEYGGSAIHAYRDYVLGTEWVYVAGYTNSTDFPVTAGAFQSNNAGGLDIFISKFKINTGDLYYSTYLGGTGHDYVNNIEIYNSVYITGYTGSTDFPITDGAFQTNNAGGESDVFISRLSPTLNHLEFSSYIGGASSDKGYALSKDENGEIYITGFTQSTGFPTTINAFDNSHNGQHDVFVTKICPGPESSITLVTGNNTIDQEVCLNTAIENCIYTTQGITNSEVTGLPSGVVDTWNSSGNNGSLTISGTPDTAGTFTYQITFDGYCLDSIITGTITVIPNNTITLLSNENTESQEVCKNDAIANIIYSSSGATGADITGLPHGVTGIFSGNATNGTITISGSPDTVGIFPYQVALIGGCGNLSAQGTIKVTDCSSGIAEQKSDPIHIYPNPAHSTVTITGMTGLNRVTMVDYTGKEVYSKDVTEDKIVVNTSHFSSGVYLVKLKSEKSIYFKQLIINH